MKLIRYYYPLLLLVTALSCNKAFEDEVQIREGDTGVIGIGDDRSRQSGMRGEIIPLYAKIGNRAVTPQIYIGNALAEIVSHGQKQVTYPVSYLSTETRTVVVDTFQLRISEDALIGSTNIYIKLADVKYPPYPFIVKKPDILFPGKVTVSPLINAPFADWGRKISPIDGALGTATIGGILDMGLDKNGTLYFIDYGNLSWQDEEHHATNVVTQGLRKIEGGKITTIGGNGENEFATQLKDLKLKQINCMKVGPDGAIYMGVLSPRRVSITIPDDGRIIDMDVTIPRLLKINPISGEVKQLLSAPYDKFCMDLYPFFRAIKDGPANEAMIGNIVSIELDKAGNIYFLDQGTGSGGVALRKLSIADNTVSTFSALPNDYGEHTFYNLDGTHPQIIKTGGDLNNNSNDGFGAEVNIGWPRGMALAGNGKFYIAQGPTPEMQECVREFNPLTKEVSTIVGRPANAPNRFAYTGTFKEVDIRAVTSFDADFDGNLLFSCDEGYGATRMIYKMDVNKEMIYKIAGYQLTIDNTRPLPGDSANLGKVSRIVFDQFGKLFVGYSRDNPAPVFITTITLDRK